MISGSNTPQEVCPYCRVRDCNSDDHIFLAAIGGRRTIRSCKPCNDVFGHSFEASAVASNLYPLIVQLGGIGVALIDTGAKWNHAAVRDDGQVYNAVLDADGYRLESTRPIVRRDPANPKRFDVTVGDDAVGQKHLKPFLDPAKFRVISTDRTPVENLNTKGQIGFNPDMKLTALKMAFAAGTIAFPKEVQLFDVARKELLAHDLATAPSCVEADLRNHTPLDKLRDDLCHVIYLEQVDRRIHAFVQFFGALQFWIQLAGSSTQVYDKAFLATLDPVSGVECFVEVGPLHLSPFDPDCLIDALLPIRKLNSGAAKRGGRTSEMIKLTGLKADGVEVPLKPYRATSWTEDIPKKN